ncbi:hypothetical protein Tco_0375877 [Tanacetum coccineum]
MERSRCWGFQWLCVPVVAWVLTVMGCHGGDGRGSEQGWESESESLGSELRRGYASFIKEYRYNSLDNIEMTKLD